MTVRVESAIPLPPTSLLTVCTAVPQDDVRPHPLHPTDRVRTDTGVAYAARVGAVGQGRSERVRVNRGSLASGRRTEEPKNPFPILGLRQRRLGSSAHHCNCLTRSIRLGGRRRATRSGPHSGRAPPMRWTADRRRRLFSEPPALAITQSSSALPPASHAPRRDANAMSVPGKLNPPSPKSSDRRVGVPNCRFRYVSNPTPLCSPAHPVFHRLGRRPPRPATPKPRGGIAAAVRFSCPFSSRRPCPR